jgi:hypothetical protein
MRWLGHGRFLPNLSQLMGQQSSKILRAGGKKKKNNNYNVLIQNWGCVVFGDFKSDKESLSENRGGGRETWTATLCFCLNLLLQYVLNVTPTSAYLCYHVHQATLLTRHVQWVILLGRVGNEWCEMALFGRCRGESPCAPLLIMSHNVHCANYTTQGNYQTLTSTVCMTWHSKTPDPASALISMGCFQFRYTFRHRQVDQTTRIQQNCTGEKALATNTIHYLNQDWPTSTNRRAT